MASKCIDLTRPARPGPISCNKIFINARRSTDFSREDGRSAIHGYIPTDVISMSVCSLSRYPAVYLGIDAHVIFSDYALTQDIRACRMRFFLASQDLLAIWRLMTGEWRRLSDSSNIPALCLVDPSPGKADARHNPHATAATHPLPGVFANVRLAFWALQPAIEIALVELRPHPGERVQKNVRAKVRLLPLQLIAALIVDDT